MIQDIESEYYSIPGSLFGERMLSTSIYRNRRAVLSVEAEFILFLFELPRGLHLLL